MFQTMIRAGGMIYFIIINKNHKKVSLYFFKEKFCVEHGLVLSGILNDYLLSKVWGEILIFRSHIHSLF